ncbi:MAG: LptF/LptG family permease [Candidatus Omnitrophica bacterium]|nr:LptF/LptG family permease [Candidatus Omnitrophota bacterium]
MKIIGRYILAELAWPWFFTLFVLTFVMLMGNLIKVTDLIINKGIGPLDIARLFAYFIPYLLTYTVPMSTLIAILLTFGRLANDNEIIALRSSGMNLAKLLVPLLAVGVILSLGGTMINDRLLPMAHFESRKIIKNIAAKSPLAYLEAGTFVKDFSHYILFIYEINGHALKNVRIYEPKKDGPTRTIIAEEATVVPMPHNEGIVLTLFNGTSDEPNPRKPGSFYKLNFKKYTIALDLSEALAEDASVNKKPSDMNIQEILHEKTTLDAIGIDTKPLETELHRKISLAFASLCFIILGFSLALLTKRSEKSIAFGIGLLIIVSYYVLLAGGKALSLKGVFAPSLCMWTPNIIALIAGIALFKHANRY